jgi:hypothetical protein
LADQSPEIWRHFQNLKALSGDLTVSFLEGIREVPSRIREP